MKVLCVVILLSAATLPALAHHSISAGFDEKKATTLRGIITKVDWTNPHVNLTMEVKEPTGAITTWRVDLAAPYALEKDGIQKESIQIMKACDLSIWPAKDGSHIGSGRTLTFEDGKPLDVHDRWSETGVTRVLIPER